MIQNSSIKFIRESEYGYKNNLVIATDKFPLNDQEIEALTTEIISQIINTDKGITINGTAEGMQRCILETNDKLSKFLFHRYGFPLSKITYLTSAEPAIENVNFYVEYLNAKNLNPVPIVFTNTLERMMAMYNSEFVHMSQLNIKPKHKNKKFLFMNGNMREHRAYLLAYVLKNNLLDSGHVSMLRFYPQSIDDNSALDSIFGYKHWASDILRKNYNLFPMTLVAESYKQLAMHSIPENEMHLYDDSYFGLVAETHYFRYDYPGSDNWLINQYLITEKTYKYILGKLPFILAGFAGSLKVLRDRGYKTFHPFIDESYDEEVDDIVRLHKICKEIQRLCKFNNSQFLKFMEDTIPITNHNYKRFMESKFETLTWRPN